jgi:hypothetical protein
MRPASLAALCALATTGCGGAPVPAEEPTQVVLTPPPARSRARSRIERMLRSAEAQGYRMARVAVPLGDIPRAEVPPMFGPGDIEGKREVTEGLRLSDIAFIEGREASWSCPSHGADRHKLCAACMNPANPHAVRAEGPVAGSAAGRALTYEIVDGIRAPSAPGAVLGARSTRVVAKELLPHILYSFRFTDEREPGIELISFVLPPAAELEVSRSSPLSASVEVRGAFTRVTLPVRPGASETILAHVVSSAAEAWIGQLSPAAPLPPMNELIIGVELSQAGDEPEPHLVVYLERAATVATSL